VVKCWGVLALMVALVGVTVAFVVASVQRSKRDDVRGWMDAAQQLGFAAAGGQADRSMQGVLDGVPMQATFQSAAPGTQEARSSLTFLAGGQGLLPRSLTLREDSVFRSSAEQDLELGDDAFDEKVVLPTLDAHACAALSHAARQRVRQLLELHAEVYQGTLIWRMGGQSDAGAPWLIDVFKFLAGTVRLLSVPPESLHERLAHNAVNDPVAGVRLQNLRFLADTATGTSTAFLAGTARALLEDPDIAVRVLAARHAGRAGQPVLQAIIGDAGQTLEFRVDALRALGEAGILDPEQLRPLLAASEPALVCTALSLIGSGRLEALAPQVIGCLGSEQERVRAAAAEALGRLPAALAEPALIERLSDGSADVKLASAESLGRIGSVRAVEPLLALTEGLGRAQLRQAARAAIGSIQSRLGSVEAGSLSLAEEHQLAGALDLATAPAALRVGALSLTEEDTAEDTAYPQHGKKL
jgi:hypothetical protein